MKQRVGTDTTISYYYIQGSGDDEELWSNGLDHTTFWENIDSFLQVSTLQECQDWVSNLQTTIKPQKRVPSFDFIEGTNIAIGNQWSADPEKFTAIINCGAPTIEVPKDYPYLYLDIPEGKKGQHQLLKSIPSAIEFLEGVYKGDATVLVHCVQGKDRSVGIALALIIHLISQKRLDLFKVSRVDKDLISKVLCLIQQSRSVCSPTRCTIKRVNEYFMSQGYKQCWLSHKGTKIAQVGVESIKTIKLLFIAGLLLLKKRKAERRDQLEL
jgi:tRNA A64-2'-O-ribosylphosphate transferase